MKNSNLTDTQKKILAKMKEHNNVALSPKQIADLTGIPHQTVKQSMRQLIHSKYVTQKYKKGGYTLTKNVKVA